MLRVMTWNIRTGGRDRTGPGRLDRVVRVVTAQAPDVLALQELRGFDRGGLLAEVAGQVGMIPHLARSWFGQPVAVLVRPPWRTLAAGPLRRPFHHAAQRVLLATDVGPLTVLSAHLDPYTGVRRLLEAGWLAAATRRGELALLAGDLNTLEPGADHTERVARLPAAYRRRHLRRDGRTVETRAVGGLLAAGLVDLWAATGAPPDEGLTAPTEHGGGAEFSGMRLDYVFGTPALAARLRSCRVVRGGETEYASDHYPVVAELDLDPA
ncbi:endonuclease/exonuclease/phosphatase family protein [Micromonospora sp. CPCC 205711]|uniref:endonuclease/exonuclease/phosphatase family protein n=1 Tax=Micromonospora sp. CPCC 205547 TaxID=3122400 RepID=UPI002FF0CD99